MLPPKERQRDQIKAIMKEHGVSLPGGVYETPLHRQPVFETMAAGSFPVADDLCARHICLPLYYGMTEEEARQVIEALQIALGHERTSRLAPVDRST